MALYLSLPDNVVGAATTAGSFSTGLVWVLSAGKVQDWLLSGAGGATVLTGTAGPAKSPKSSSLSSREAGCE